MRRRLWMILQLQVIFSLAEQNKHLWKQVYVSKVMLDRPIMDISNTAFKFENISIQRLWFCATLCASTDWCTLWCYDEATSRCTKSNALVSPLYVSDSSDVYKCYTYQEKDFVVGAIATSSAINPYSPTRTAANLVRGIYNFYATMTCWESYSNNVWILFDLTTTQTVQEIQVTSQWYNWNGDLPSGAEIRIGTTPPVATGNFSNLQLVGQFPNPSAELMTYSFKLASGTRARYISIKKKGSAVSMTLCRIMAF